MAYFKAILENKTKGKKFQLNVVYSAKTDSPIDFVFRNANKSIEARSLKIEDKDGNIIEPHFRGHIKPLSYDPIVTSITDTQPFVYEMKTEIDKWDDQVVLNFITSFYRLDKGTPYYFYLIYEDEQTNKVEITF
jgi:hypothetical protein